MTFSIRPADENDASAIATIAQLSWQQTYAEIFPLAMITEFLSLAYSVDNLKKRIQNDQNKQTRLFLVATTVSNEIVAFAQATPDKNLTGSYELIRIYAKPDFFGTGVGKALFDHFLTHVEDLRELNAWVEAKNQVGQAFFTNEMALMPLVKRQKPFLDILQS
ncbi:GNAT family N-acetyltransferase [Brevibacillus daliensis]|uniref:GNAT family N-acetyltransferase n=1 Tax=Brevibacillus daliensis TaxID=2892995 RepID=UPI001E507A7F|nr:GNAT family N-acetyltransferase [Brevibacillus daliensis]